MKTEKRLSDLLVEFARTPITDFPFQSILDQIGHGDRLTSGEGGHATTLADRSDSQELPKDCETYGCRRDGLVMTVVAEGVET